MYKKLIAMITCVFLIGVNAVYAGNVPTNIRIGLESKYKNVSSVTVSNKSISIGHEINNIFNVDTEINSNSGFVFSVPIGNFSALNKGFSSYSEAKNEAENYKNKGYDAFPACTGNGIWDVYASGESSGDFSLTSSGKAVIVKSGNDTILAFNGVYPQILALDNNSIVKLGDKGFRGIIEFGRYTGSITAINVISMDEYLYSVVPSEMPPSYEMEALKAQAVAARTYTVTKMGAHKDSGYELCDNIHCQMYKGTESEHERTTQAVNETTNIMAYYNNEPIEAVYSASSGGHTDNSINVFINDLPYLKGVEEINEPDTSWTRTFTYSDIESLLSTSGSNIGNVTSVAITKFNTCGRVQEMTIYGTNGNKVLEKESVRTFFSPKGGSLTSRLFTIGENDLPSADNSQYSAPEIPQQTAATNSQQIFTDGEELAFVDNSGTQYPYAQIGQIFIIDDTMPIPKPTEAKQNNNVNTNTNTNTNKKNNSAVLDVPAVSSSGDTVVINGKGNGHGVGLSQMGAGGMAKLGYSYKDILTHYYTGITVE